MNIAGIATVIYGSLIEAGGVVGFLVAKSKPSLIAGAVLGNLALIGGILLLLEIPEGRWVAIGAAGVVGLAFAVKLAKAIAADAAGTAGAAGAAAQKDGEEKAAGKKDEKAAKAAHDDKAAKPEKAEKSDKDAKADASAKDAKSEKKKAKGKVRAAALVALSLAEIIIVLVYA